MRKLMHNAALATELELCRPYLQNLLEKSYPHFHLQTF